MGIKGLWNVLTPYSEKKSMHEIRGETLAIDLSGWVCDSQNVTDYHIQPKLYLRNLFFRTIYLLLAEINPIFVLEGDAPALKCNVMAARNAIQFRGAAPRTGTGTTKQPDVGRKRFKNVLKECEILLNCMGVRCVKGDGEAEATCAAMNEQVVSQDSDCFAYGARRVYRNFSVSSAAGGGALQGSVDCYDAQRMLSNNGFGRNKMVALAMLCGCDYGVGACGSSINTVVSFLHTVPDADIIPRLLSWVSDPEYYERRARWAGAPGRCDRCGHAGRAHARSGCPVCATHRGCGDNQHKSKVSEVKRELSLRSRALSCGMLFPETKIMNEFLQRTSERIDIDSLKQPAPSLIQFVKLMTKKLEWSERYCVVKFLPLLTKWHLQDNVPSRSIRPIAIKKKRTPRGVPSFEVVWSDIDDVYEGLIPDDQFEEDEDPSIVWTTTERQDLMRRYYLALVEEFEESIKKPPKVKKTRQRKKNDNDNSERPKRKYNRKLKKVIDAEIHNLSESLRKMDILKNRSELNGSKANVSVKVNKLKRKIKATSKRKSQRSIDSFIAIKRKKSHENLKDSLDYSVRNISHVSIREDIEIPDADECNKENDKKFIKHLNMFDESQSDLDECELSDIVDRIVTRAPASRTAKVDNNLVQLIFNKCVSPRKSVFKKSILSEIHMNSSTPNNSPKKNIRFSANVSNNLSRSRESKVNTSYFFDKLTENRDAFEVSFDYKHKSAIIDCDETVDYSLPDVCL